MGFAMKYAFCGVLLFLVCCGAICVHARDFVQDVQQYYDTLSTFSAQFEQTLQHKESGSTEMRKGTIQFKKPLQILWQTNSPHNEQWIVSKNDIWDFLPDEEVVYRYAASLLKDSGGIIGLLTGQVSLRRDFTVKPVGEEGGLHKLLLLPKEPSIQLVEALAWLDGQGAINKIRSTDFYGNVNEIKLINIKKNITLGDQLFNFKPPKGVEVEDLRNSDLQKNLFQ